MFKGAIYLRRKFSPKLLFIRLCVLVRPTRDDPAVRVVQHASHPDLWRKSTPQQDPGGHGVPREACLQTIHSHQILKKGLHFNDKLQLVFLRSFFSHSQLAVFFIIKIIMLHFWDMVNCSNCDCSKNLLDTILLLLDSVRTII